jgi:hypothetical protein
LIRETLEIGESSFKKKIQKDKFKRGIQMEQYNKIEKSRRMDYKRDYRGDR